MNNLTEQCKQRKLPDGLYWVKHDGVINILDNYEAHLTEVEEVLAEVPSYNGYMTLIRAYNNVVDENTKLKKLLKKIRRQITKQIFGSNEVQLFEGTFDNKLLAKIDQVLGEE